MLLCLGLTRTEVARMMGIDTDLFRMFMQNWTPQFNQEQPQFNFDFSRTFGVEIETHGCDQNELYQNPWRKRNSNEPRDQTTTDKSNLENYLRRQHPRQQRFWNCKPNIDWRRWFESIENCLWSTQPTPELKSINPAAYIHFSARDFNFDDLEKSL